jgi:Transmembrane secretion effector
LNPYLILGGTFLLSAGFAFSSPASSAAIAEMVSPEELAPAFTLGGLQLDLSGIIGPLVFAGISVWTKYDYAGIPAKLCPSAPGLPVYIMFAALAGAGWTVSASELWVASQRAMPDWARGRMNATTTMVAQGATVLGGIVWGLAAHALGIVTTFLGAAALSLLLKVLFTSKQQFSIDFTKNLNLEPARVPILPQNLAPSRFPAPPEGPVSITAEFHIHPARRNEYMGLMREARLTFLRNGAYQWHLYEDLSEPNTFRMDVVVPSWKQHLLQGERLPTEEKHVIDQLRGLRIEPKPHQERICISVDGEVLKQTVRAEHSK